MAYLPELSPKPFETFCGALLVRFVPGNLLEEDQVQNPEMLRRIAETLKECHAVPIDERVGTFCVFRSIRENPRQARASARPRCRPTSATRWLICSASRPNWPRRSRSVFATMISLAGNFVDDGTTLRIIDWEFGGRGNRFFDLGNVAAGLQMTDAQERAFLHTYFGEMRLEDLRRMKRMRIASDFREASWGYLQAAISKLHSPQYYLDYGRRHLDRCLAAARTMRLGHSQF